MAEAEPQNRVAVGSPDPAMCVGSAEFRLALSKLTTAVSIITTDGLAGIPGVTCSTVPPRAL